MIVINFTAATLFSSLCYHNVNRRQIARGENSPRPPTIIVEQTIHNRKSQSTLCRSSGNEYVVHDLGLLAFAFRVVWTASIWSFPSCHRRPCSTHSMVHCLSHIVTAKEGLGDRSVQKITRSPIAKLKQWLMRNQCTEIISLWLHQFPERKSKSLIPQILDTIIKVSVWSVLYQE